MIQRADSTSRVAGVGAGARRAAAGWLAMIAIRLESPGHPIYRQRRVGRDGEPFDISSCARWSPAPSTSARASPSHEGDPRITRVGALLRRTSLDELPNLVNVLRGEMSIVGPRPTVPVQVDQYTERQRGRLAVKPGITGWAQIHGRASLPWSRADRARPLLHRAPLAGGSTCEILARTLAMMLGRRRPLQGRRPAAGTSTDERRGERARDPAHRRRQALRHRRRRSPSTPRSSPPTPTRSRRRSTRRRSQVATLPPDRRPGLRGRAARSSASEHERRRRAAAHRPRHRGAGAGARATGVLPALVADAEIARATYDKYETHLLLERHRAAVAADGRCPGGDRSSFPVIVKPR